MKQKRDGWALIEAGEYEAAIQKFRREYKRDKEPSTATDLGIAYLLSGDPAAALVVFDSLLDHRWVSTGNYALAGVARWALGKRKEAASVWSKGIGCQYADAAGGMELPLLLYFAAARDSGAFSLAEAEKAVKRASKHEWAECWPGPLGDFVLGKLSETEVRQAASFTEKYVERCQTAQVEFYVGVRALAARDVKTFKQQMQRCVEIPDWYLENEFHLAHVEALSG